MSEFWRHTDEGGSGDDAGNDDDAGHDALHHAAHDAPLDAARRQAVLSRLQTSAAACDGDRVSGKRLLVCTRTRARVTGFEEQAKSGWLCD